MNGRLREVGGKSRTIETDPPTAYASLVRRDNIRGVIRHMHGGRYGQDTIDRMETFFENWTKASPLIFVNYEALYDHLKDIADALGVHFRRFPARRPRKSCAAEDVPERLLRLRERFDALPEFFVNDSARELSSHLNLDI
jgi:hypothetical protein